MGCLFLFWNLRDACYCCCELFLASYVTYFLVNDDHYISHVVYFASIYAVEFYQNGKSCICLLIFVHPFYGVIGLFLKCDVPFCMMDNVTLFFFFFLPQILDFHLESHFSSSKLNAFCVFKSWLLNPVKVIVFNLSSSSYLSFLRFRLSHSN